MVEHHVEFYYVLLMTVNVTLSLIVMLAACLCCKKKVPKNDLLGLEGMVKLKNPDEVLVVTTVAKTESHGDLNISTLSTADSDKRASTAAHRSLPDIPVAETNGDTGSELYETVAEKMLLNAQNKQQTSPTPSLKKQTSVSQHSSISQADDVSSPYSRVKNSPHNYAKVRTTEHPYAQLNPPSTSAAAAAAAAVANAANSSATSQQSSTLNRSSQQSSDSVQNLSESPIHAEIPAASAIAGMISASQDLPYMTPPIANQHFSGDSQDSSKGYTSISVREPLANILAQQPTKILQRNPPLSRDVNDSHYATVSDDSDETYAAIEDPNLRHLQNTAADIYTSGSETYAQIQPMQGGNSIVVSVEINNTAQPSVITQHQQQQQQHFDSIASGIAQQAAAAAAPGPTAAPSTQNHRLSLEHATPIPPPVDSLRAQMHSRQASSSSNNSSSVGNLGSPKPEKRQANSPLPPTPKSNTSLQYHLHAATSSSNTSLTSGRNSVISVLEVTSVQEANEAIGSSEGAVEQEVGNNELSPQKKHKSLSPSKDIEGMYAKVMKKNKNSGNASNSQQNSPIMSRRHHDSSLGVSPLDSAAAQLLDAHAINLSASSSSGASRIRSNSYTAKDHGYETIPADSMRNANISTASSGGVLALENRKSDIYPNVLQKERQQLEHSSAFGTQLKAPATISVNVGNTVSKISSTSLGGGNKPTTTVEKYYETIASPPSANNSDPGYETLKINTDQELESEKKSDYDPNYEVLKSTTAQSDDGYAKVLEKKPNLSDTHDGYTKVKGEEEEEEGNIPGYSTIGEVKGGGATADANHNYASIAETKKLASKAEMEHDDDDDGVNTETEPDHYARINEARLPAAKEPSLSAASTPGRLTTEDLLSPRPQLVTSPSSMNSSSFFNTSSMASSSTTVTTSTSTMSSRQTPSSSQYESLTGSETDPNYESVCYLSGSAATENPYERLQTEYSDLQLSSSSSSLAVATQSASTPTKVAASNHSTAVEPVGVGKTAQPDKEVGSSVGKPAVDVLVVDDYFQV